MARILIAEDELLVRELACEDLTEAGHTVVQARDGEEAAEVLAADAGFDVLFTDIRMPGAIDGWQLARIARQCVPDIRTIFATGLADDDRSLAPHERRLQKPYMVEDVLRLLDELKAPGSLGHSR